MWASNKDNPGKGFWCVWQDAERSKLLTGEGVIQAPSAFGLIDLQIADMAFLGVVAVA